jgi:hypothetical protein
MAYFGSVHLAVSPARRWFAREVIVGLVFALATAIPAWSQTLRFRAHMVLLVLFFAALCCLNTIAIEVWEQAAKAPRFPVPLAAGLLAISAGALALSPEMHDSAAGALVLCAGLSAMVLFSLDALHRRRSSQSAAPAESARWLLLVRVAADAALLTPLLFVLPWR